MTLDTISDWWLFLFPNSRLNHPANILDLISVVLTPVTWIRIPGQLWPCSLWTWYSNVKSKNLECHTGFKWLYHLHFLALCCKKLSRTFLGPRPGTQSKYAHVTRPLLASDWSLSPILASDWLTLAKVWSPWHHSLPHLCVCVSGGDQRLTPNIYTLLFFFLDTTNQTSWWC